MTIEISNLLLSTIGSAALVSAALWLTRNLLITRLTKAVSHEYDEKLAIINSDLSSKISEIESLRDGILGGVANRQRLLYERRLKAVEQLWNLRLLLFRSFLVPLVDSSFDSLPIDVLISFPIFIISVCWLFVSKSGISTIMLFSIPRIKYLKNSLIVASF